MATSTSTVRCPSDR